VPRFDHDVFVENVDRSFVEISAHVEGWWDAESGFGSLTITGEMQANVPTTGAQLDRCRVHIPHVDHWINLHRLGLPGPGLAPGLLPAQDMFARDWAIDHDEVYSGTRSHRDVSFSLQVENFEVRAERMHDLRFGHEDTILDFTVEATSTDVSAATGQPGFTTYEVVVSLLPRSMCGEHHVCDCSCRERCCRRRKHRRHKSNTTKSETKSEIALTAPVTLTEVPEPQVELAKVPTQEPKRT
jgi:hypothetical protein